MNDEYEKKETEKIKIQDVFVKHKCHRQHSQNGYFSIKLTVKVTGQSALVSFERVSLCLPHMKSISLMVRKFCLWSKFLSVIIIHKVTDSQDKT